VVAILLPAALFVRLRRRRGADLPFMQLGLSTSRPSGFLLGVAGGALFGSGLFYVLSVFIEPLLEHFIPVPPEERAHLLRLLRPSSGLRPLWQDLLCFAAVPALCEELLFRGAIFSTLGAQSRSEAGPMHPANLRAVLLSATLFGVFHLSPSKIFPTALLGIGFGFAAILSRSLWPAIIMHFTNNALVVVLIRAGLEEVPQGGTSYLVILSIGSLLLIALGIRLLRASARKIAASAG
jgi:membrane protease YdiL (CAAX protease family)